MFKRGWADGWILCVKQRVDQERVVLGTITVTRYPTLGMTLEPDWPMKWATQKYKYPAHPPEIKDIF